MSQDNSAAPNASPPPAKRPMRNRFKPQIKAGMRLEERDLRLLTDLFLHRLMSRGQLERLYFTSASRCNVRLRQLFDHRLVSRYYLPLAPYGAQCLYSLGEAGILPVSLRLQWEIDEVKRQTKRHQTPQFLEHTLAINETRLAFRDALNASPLWKLERWIPEIQCRHPYDIRGASGAWQREVFKPDGFLRLQNRQTRQNTDFFFEIDRGHTSSSKFCEKLDSYARYGESGLFAQMFGQSSFATLVITTGPLRLKNLRVLVEGKGSRLFRFTTFTELEAHGPLSRIWRFPFEEELQNLI